MPKERCLKKEQHCCVWPSTPWQGKFGPEKGGPGLRRMGDLRVRSTSMGPAMGPRTVIIRVNVDGSVTMRGRSGRVAAVSRLPGADLDEQQRAGRRARDEPGRHVVHRAARRRWCGFILETVTARR